MIQSINQNQFQDAFMKLRSDNFSYEGLNALYNYLEQLEDDMEKSIELDVIALCCEYSEYKNLEHLQEDYSDIETMEDLMLETTVIPVGKEGFIIQNF